MPPLALPPAAAAVVVQDVTVASKVIERARATRAGAARKRAVREVLLQHGHDDAATVAAVYEQVRTDARLAAEGVEASVALELAALQ